ncbi:integrase core domain protein [Plakobranchus ocellatus]|uniref:Integrase core domain protein n=1 Tax=Plakobranchus ocellatus TaxID=259542 RepID=A0AAV3Y0M8_9GAST|nr:integrase core domain protein [Plakobranchus ocellatus]
MVQQPDNGKEFASIVISSGKECWPTFKTVYGKPHHPQSQEMSKELTRTLKICCVLGCRKNSVHWSESFFILGLKEHPYELSGCKAKVGLTALSLPEGVERRWHSGLQIRPEMCRDPSVADSSPATGALA